MAEERRQLTLIKPTNYQQHLVKASKYKVRPQSYVPEDLVLKKVLLGDKKSSDGKLGPIWQGPYEYTSVAGVGAYCHREREMEKS